MLSEESCFHFKENCDDVHESMHYLLKIKNGDLDVKKFFCVFNYNYIRSRHVLELYKAESVCNLSYQKEESTSLSEVMRFQFFIFFSS